MNHNPQSEVLSRITGLKVLVVGDAILDVYTIADAVRISPEAPVPILVNPRTEYRPGGAAAVAMMCSALGAETVLLGVTGNDRDGQHLTNLLEAFGVGCYLIGDETRPTTRKERICAIASGRHRQQLARLDTESTTPICADLSHRIAGMIRGMDGIDLLLVADYDKGLMMADVAMACVETVPCIVDPPRPNGANRDWHKYAGATCLVPNREEAGCWYARGLWTQLNLDAAVVKQDSDGCILSTREEDQYHHIPAKARAVHDVTGAGDQFLAVLGCAKAAGASWREAAELANTAAGLQVERHGCVPVNLFEIAREVAQWQSVP